MKCHEYTWPLFPISCLDSHSIGIMLFAELTNPMTVREEFGALKCWENMCLLALPMNLVWSIQLPRCEDQRTAECHFFGSLLNMLRWRWILVSQSEHQFQKSTIFLTRYSSNLTEKGEGTVASHGYDFANSHKKYHVHSTGWLEIPKSQGCAERSRRREGS